MESSPLLRTRANDGFQTRIREFQESDTKVIREIYLQAMLYGPGSPGRIALQYQLRRPLAFVFYGVFILGLVLSYYPPTRIPGIVLSIATFVLFFAWRRSIWNAFANYVKSAVDGDLSNITKHYRLQDPTNPGGFWVAEIADGSAAGRVIGCVGLDSSTNPDPSTAELRHMVVSPSSQQHGAGSLLLKNLIEHAKVRGLSTVFLSTSMYQTVAMRFYEQFGFFEEKRVAVRLRFLFIVNKGYLYFYKLKL